VGESGGEDFHQGDKKNGMGVVLQMHVVRSGPQGIKPELQNLTEGGSFPSPTIGRSPPRHDHRRGCATAFV
jgi:hypothetical protein